jgi:threonine dehydratase
MEIIKLMNGKRLDAIFICTGGGGLLSGIAAAVKALRPDIKIIGVEADDAAGMTASLRAGKVITLPTVGLFADGAAVKTVGNETFKVCHQLVDEMITVQTGIFTTTY